ncbi:hypothetical protein L228DRAFT_141567 [Xylona heveae TC161]|uniref:Nitrogen regulatory protein areA GATA-like domain-containing protein n=1 Tax=Xylona heveae (strain CBS 132557 / TC161) TaxID=1328760 RepID=A0A165H5Q9_XYLHT|nr:hypothetical protein L228DRAFT_141567 [Xylona heveae TC161]KZF23023.1 hypothetical protein L228DRAFT_141567 [Xylona heveae TC161]
MTTMLPTGVIRNSDGIGGEIQSIDHVAIEDIARLWRVYRTNRRALQGDTGGRLENFFWRIWSNGQVNAGITGSAVARIFLHISESKSNVGKTPRPTSHPHTQSELRPEYVDQANLHIPPPSPSASSSSSHPPVIRVSSDGDTSMPSPESAANGSSPSPSPKPLPPPILKSGRKLSGSEPTKTARIASPVPAADDSDDGLAPSPHPRSPLASSFEEHHPPHHHPHAHQQHQLHPHRVHHPHVTHMPPGRKKKGKTVFVAGAGPSRRRPAMTRRKSSQSSASTLKSHRSDPGDATLGSSSRPKSRPSGSPETSMARYSPSPPPVAFNGDSAAALADASFADESPLRAPSPNDVASRSLYNTERDRASSAEQHGSIRPYDDWGANRDFQARISDRSSSDMFRVLSGHPTQTKAAPIVAPTSTAAAGVINKADSPPAASSQPTIINRILPLKQPVAASITNHPATDENEMPPTPPNGLLPRTKSQSQLSFLLERDRRHSEEAAKAQQHLYRKTST